MFRPSPDNQRALTAYEEAVRIDSLNTSALNNAAVVYGEMREYERAEQLYRRVIALPRTFGGAFTNLLQEQIRNGRLGALDSTVAAYHARFPESNDLWEAEWMAAWGRGEFARADSLARAAYARGRSSRQQVRGADYTSRLASLRGRPREALEWAERSSQARLRAVPSVRNRLEVVLDTAFHAAFVQRDADRTREVLARAFARYPMDSITPLDRPWGALATLGLMIRDPALARQGLAGYDRDLASAETDPEGGRSWYAAAVALAERRGADAVERLHDAYARFSIPPRIAFALIAEGHDMAGNADSTIVYLERFLGSRDPLPNNDARWRAASHRRLGELYEAKGDTRRALEQYVRFTELWADAEPELQPQVQEIRSRIARLRPQLELTGQGA